jgi:uncharacterized damage-inducible protein DinB
MAKTSAPSTRSATREDPFTLLFPDLEGELKTTRRFLERVPNGKDDWRPHAKSKSLGELAAHVAQLPGLGILMLTRDEHDGASQRPQPKAANSAERVKMFDEVSGELQRLLKKMTWDHAMSPWTLKFGDRVLLKGPRANLLRSAFVTHSAHHRAQLGVYLRLLDVPVPASYGPSADEGPPPR